MGDGPLLALPYVGPKIARQKCNSTDDDSSHVAGIAGSCCSILCGGLRRRMLFFVKLFGVFLPMLFAVGCGPPVKEEAALLS